MPAPLARPLLFLVVAIGLAACSSGGALSPGLAARMDIPGAQLNRAEALGIVNNYRQTVGAGALTEDAGLDATAQQLAAQYAKSGNQPAKPAGALQIRYSAGYFTFAETFSGWRNSPTDAPALSDKSATKAGIAAVYDKNSPYGVYWVIVLA
ncbi:MAG TPA: CAP domain-containing protein [Devosia sp.]|nr:CAP domain-containing protein [Devosia sp.]